MHHNYVDGSAFVGAMTFPYSLTDSSLVTISLRLSWGVTEMTETLSKLNFFFFFFFFYSLEIVAGCRYK